MTRAVFLDRDGVIIEDVDYLSNVKDVSFIDGVPKAIKMLNAFGYRVIVITNQSVIARGKCTEDTLKDIHQFIQSELSKNNATIDAIYYCPHHPDYVYQGVTDCECRKPAIALVTQAIKKFGIDVTESYFVGDKESDITCGKRAGLTTVGVDTGYGCVCENDFPDFQVKNLLDFVESVLH